MSRDIMSLAKVLPVLRVIWILVFLIGLLLGEIALAGFGTESRAGQVLLFLGAAVVGFAASALFSRQDQFLFRGCGDTVYMIQNNWVYPRIFSLSTRETVDALGGIWHEIIHISNRTLGHLPWLIDRGGPRGLDVGKADLYRCPERTVFAVLNSTRYGIPDEETLRRIWPKKAPCHLDETGLDKFNPGRDLVSVNYWPINDRMLPGQKA